MTLNKLMYIIWSNDFEMNLIICDCDRIDDVWGFCLYCNDLLVSSKCPGWVEHYHRLYFDYPQFPYKEDFYLDLIKQYEKWFNCEIDKFTVYRVCLFPIKSCKHFSEYTKDDIHSIKKVIECFVSEYRQSYYQNPKNLKQYCLINRRGQYLTNDFRWSYDISDALIDSYDNFEYYYLDGFKKFDNKLNSYSAYKYGIQKIDRMKYLEDTYRKQSNSYFSNVFNKNLSYKYLQCWDKK